MPDEDRTSLSQNDLRLMRDAHSERLAVYEKHYRELTAHFLDDPTDDEEEIRARVMVSEGLRELMARDMAWVQLTEELLNT